MRTRAKLTVLATIVTAFATTGALAVPASAAPVTAAPTTTAPTTPNPADMAKLRGITKVTTAPGLAATLLRAGVVPLPVPPTKTHVGFEGDLTVTYGFPITGGDAELGGPSGDILHSGGLNFVSFKGAKLEIGKFDISLDDGVIYATEVNFAPGRIPVLDLDLTNLKVKTKANKTVLTGIKLLLDPAAADALNATFGLSLPNDGSLVFGSGKVVLRG